MNPLMDIFRQKRANYDYGGITGGYNVSGNQDFYQGNANIGGTLGPLDISVNMSKTKGSDIEKEATVRFEKEMSMIDGLVVDGYYSKAESDEARFNAGVRFHKEIADGLMFNSYLQTDGIDKSGGAGITYSFNKGGRVGPSRRGLVSLPGGYAGTHHAGMDGTSDNDGSMSNTGLGGQYGLGAGEDDPGTGDYAGTGGLGVDSTRGDEAVHNPHKNTIDISEYDPPGEEEGEDLDPEKLEKKPWYKTLWNNLQTDFEDTFTPENLTRTLMAIAMAKINPSGFFGLDGWGAFFGNTAMTAAMSQATAVEKGEEAVAAAQDSLAAAQATVDASQNTHRMGEANDALAAAEQAMANAEAGLATAQSNQDTEQDAAFKATINDHGGHKQNEMLASNPYQGQLQGTQGGSWAPDPNYSHYVLSEDEQQLADSLIAMGYPNHSAIQYSMHYHNNPEAPAYT